MAINIEGLKANKDVEGLIQALNDMNEAHIRKEAAVALREIGDARAVEPLIAILKDSDSGVRIESVRALEVLGDTRAVEPLIATLMNERDFSVRSWAARALGQIGDKRAVVPLIAALKDVWIQGQAVEALGNIADEKAVDPLISFLIEVSDNYSRDAAVRSLGKIGNTKAVEFLISALEDKSPDIQGSAARALTQLNVRLDNRQQALLVVASGDWEAAIGLGPIAVDALIGALNSNGLGVPSRAAMALAKIGDSRGINKLTQLITSGDTEKVSLEDIREALQVAAENSPNTETLNALKNTLPLTKAFSPSLHKWIRKYLKIDYDNWVRVTPNQKIHYSNERWDSLSERIPDSAWGQLLRMFPEAKTHPITFK
jgi:HEAT repeat protein